MLYESPPPTSNHGPAAPNASATCNKGSWKFIHSGCTTPLLQLCLISIQNKDGKASNAVCHQRPWPCCPCDLHKRQRKVSSTGPFTAAVHCLYCGCVLIASRIRWASPPGCTQAFLLPATTAMLALSPLPSVKVSNKCVLLFRVPFLGSNSHHDRAALNICSGCSLLAQDMAATLLCHSCITMHHVERQASCVVHSVPSIGIMAGACEHRISWARQEVLPGNAPMQAGGEDGGTSMQICLYLHITLKLLLPYPPVLMPWQQLRRLGHDSICIFNGLHLLRCASEVAGRCRILIKKPYLSCMRYNDPAQRNVYQCGQQPWRLGEKQHLHDPCCSAAPHQAQQMCPSSTSNPQVCYRCICAYMPTTNDYSTQDYPLCTMHDLRI